MADENNKQKLVSLLERKAWNPVLEASPKNRDESGRKRLERVQRKSEAQRDRYRAYTSAGAVRQEFEDDLRSQPARRTNVDLKKLGLPVQADVADEFFALAARLGVGPERGRRRPHKPHPPHPWYKPEEREKAKRELTRKATPGDKAAIDTLKKAPRKWARELRAKLSHDGSKRGKQSSAKRR